MKLYINRRGITVRILILVALASSVNMIFEARNYVLMYESLKELRFNFSKIIYLENRPDNGSIVVELVVHNSIDYGGDKATLVYVTASFSSSGASLFKESPLALGFLISRDIPANAFADWNFTIHLNMQNATSLYKFYRAYMPNITANATSRVAVTTIFLTAVSQVTSEYENQQNVTLT